MVAVPVDVALGAFRVDVLTVGKVETAVIVLGVVSAVCSGSSVVSCQFQIDIPLFLYFFFLRSLMRSNHRGDTLLLNNRSHISRPRLEIFSRNREVILSEKDLCVCYTAKKAAYRSFPQWEIMAFVAFCLEEFDSALQEKYNRISCKVRGPCTSTFVDLIRLFLPQISKMPYRRIYYSTRNCESRGPRRPIKWACQAYFLQKFPKSVSGH